MEKRFEFTVMGEDKIHCSGCEQRICNVLRRLPGVQQAWASALSQRVVVTIDPAQVGPGQVEAKLGQLGYRVAPKGGGSA